MRDLSQDSSLLSINSMTVKPWSLEQLVEGCASAGISAISPWRDIVQACGLERAAKLISAHGMTVTGLCRGGMFPAADDAGRRQALDDNRGAVGGEHRMQRLDRERYARLPRMGQERGQRVAHLPARVADVA